jgi:hypothetical protein
MPDEHKPEPPSGAKLILAILTLLRQVDHVLTAHEANGPCFDTLRENAADVRRLLS